MSHKVFIASTPVVVKGPDFGVGPEGMRPAHDSCTRSAQIGADIGIMPKPCKVKRRPQQPRSAPSRPDAPLRGGPPPPLRFAPRWRISAIVLATHALPSFAN